MDVLLDLAIGRLLAKINVSIQKNYRLNLQVSQKTIIFAAAN